MIRDDFIGPLEQELRRTDPAPDQVGDVMRRLGLSPVSARERRRRRTRRAVTRLGVCTIALGAAVAGTFWYAGTLAPQSPSLPSAIHHDLQLHGATFGHAIRTIHDLGTPAPVYGPPLDDADRPE